MKLLEIEMDLPYQINETFVYRKQKDKAMDYQEVLKADYELNWKEKRRAFQLMTRCITSMIERIMQPIETKDCWKIIIECVENLVDTDYRNLLGVYAIQVQIDLGVFCSVEDYKKKEIMIDIILKGVEQLSKNVSFNLNSIKDACMKIINSNYTNEWTWEKKRIKDKVAVVRICHEIRELNIFVVILNKENEILKKKKIISTIPDERVYDKYLGKLVRIPENIVALIDKSGNEIMRLEV